METPDVPSGGSHSAVYTAGGAVTNLTCPMTSGTKEEEGTSKSGRRGSDERGTTRRWMRYRRRSKKGKTSREKLPSRWGGGGVSSLWKVARKLGFRFI